MTGFGRWSILDNEMLMAERMAVSMSVKSAVVRARILAHFACLMRIRPVH